MFKLLVLAQTQTGDFSSKDIPGLLLAVLVAAGLIFLGSGAWRKPQRERRADGAEDEDRGRSGPAAAPAAPAPAPAPPVPAQQPLYRDEGGEALAGNAPPPHPQHQTAEDRRHTIIVGSTGDGKTVTQTALMVGDIARGNQVVWLSTNAMLYHPRKQPVDLRPLARHFEMSDELDQMMAVLRWAAAETSRRMPLMKRGDDYGAPIIIYLDELGEMYRAYGDFLVETMTHIGEQGRKVEVLLVLAAHNTLKESTGMGAGLKALFKTRLVANVDQHTWTALIGTGIKLREIPDDELGSWHIPDKRGAVHKVRITMPTPRALARIAQLMPRRFDSILTASEAYRSRLPKPAGVQVLSDEDDQVPAAADGRGAAKSKITPLHLELKAMVEEARPQIAQLMQRPGMTLAQARKDTRTSARALARRLGLGNKGGNASMKVAEMLGEIEQSYGLRLYDGVVDEDGDGDDDAEGGQDGVGSAPAPSQPDHHLVSAA